MKYCVRQFPDQPGYGDRPYRSLLSTRRTINKGYFGMAVFTMDHLWSYRIERGYDSKTPTGNYSIPELRCKDRIRCLIMYRRTRLVTKKPFENVGFCFVSQIPNVIKKSLCQRMGHKIPAKVHDGAAHIPEGLFNLFG